MSHPTPGDLLELHFEELDKTRRAAVSAHVRGCGPCRAFLSEVEAVERALEAGPADAPPGDGLARVLARVETLEPARRRRQNGQRALRAVAPSLAAAAGGAVALHEGGLVAALALLAAGVLVTLALAPVLILESQRRSS